MQFKVSTRLIQIIGAEKSGKTVTAASLARNFPKVLPAPEPTVLKGCYYMQYDPAGIEALYALNLVPEWVADFTDIVDAAELLDRSQAYAADIQQLGDAVDFIVRDSISLMHMHIHNRHIRVASEKAQSLAYPAMEVDHSTLWHLMAKTGKTIVQTAHIKYAGNFMDKDEAKERRANRFKAVGLPSSILFTSSLPLGIAGLYGKIASATFMQRKIPGAPARYSLIVEDGVQSPAGSRWSPYIQATELPCDLRAIVDAVDARQPVNAMVKDKYSITAADIVDGRVSGLGEAA